MNNAEAMAMPRPNMMTSRDRPTMASKRLDLPSICDICGRARSTRNHQTCSLMRQERKAEEWAEVMANNAAAKAARGKRYVR